MVVFLEVHCVPRSRNFDVLNVSDFIRAWSDYFYDFVRSFSVSSSFPSFRSAGVLENFSLDQVTFFKFAAAYVSDKVLCGRLLIVMDSYKGLVPLFVD